MELLPHKHVRFCESILGIAGFVLEIMSNPKSIEEIWTNVLHAAKNTPFEISFTQLVYALDLLYAIGEIELVPLSDLIRRTNELD